jgi:uncharacterized membrane protein
MTHYLVAYIVAVPIFFIIDMVWLGVVAKDFYRAQLGDLLLSQFNWTAAIAFYLIFLVGLVIFAIQPALMKASWTHALLLGALFGFFTYATYDLTNLATLKNWPVFLTFFDIAWGTVLGGAVSVLTYFVARLFI